MRAAPIAKRRDFAAWAVGGCLAVVGLLGRAVPAQAEPAALASAEAAQPAAAPESMDELLQRVRQQHSSQDRQRTAREARFVSAVQERRAALEQLEAAIAAERETSAQLLAKEQHAQQQLQAQRATLTERSRELSDVLATAKQVAKESAQWMNDSLLSAQAPKRAEAVAALGASEQLPTFAQVESLWLALLDDMVQGGKVETFEAPVITAEGVEQRAEVVRVGPFNAVSDGKFLRYLPQAQRLVQLGRQPAARFAHRAAALQTSPPGALVSFPLDPSRGSILAMLTATPSLWERLAEGGQIGWVILAVGALGLLIALERGLALLWVGAKVSRQQGASEPDPSNPLGRVLATFARHAHEDAETLVLRLEERVQKELPPVQRRLSTLAVLAAIAPLLGLLGTVTGMIVTFQSISLHGVSDPKLMSGGISQALVTTELGLAVAIPLTLLHTLLSSRSRRLIQVLDERSTSLVADAVSRRRGSVPPSAAEQRVADSARTMANLEPTVV